MEWYEAASSEEVYQTLNTLAMTIESFEYLKEETYGTAIRKYQFDGDSFYKAEQLWAEQEELA